jgi:hypothetical protein
VGKLYEVSVTPVVFALYFFNKAYFVETALNYPITFAFSAINNINVAQKVQSSEDRGAQSERLD